MAETAVRFLVLHCTLASHFLVILPRTAFRIGIDAPRGFKEVGSELTIGRGAAQSEVVVDSPLMPIKRERTIS